jgi:hypothetical protein
VGPPGRQRLQIALEALPLDGRLVMRLNKAKEKKV